MVFSASQIRFAQLLFALFGVAFILFKLQPSTNVSTEQVWSDQHDWDKLDAIRNETLGVQKVFAINLVSRPDKRDSIILGSSLSNFHVKFLDGVTPDGQDAKSYPYNWNYDHKTTEYAARRAHINGLQQVVQERLASAIIMEDDSDWDVSIKAQLQSFAHAVRALQFQDTQKTPTQSPYGDDWDILWGAQRILAALSVNPSGLAEEIDIGAQFDVSLGRMCGNGYLRCFAPYPSITGGFHQAGPRAKSSDIHDETSEQEDFFSWGVMYSTMLNINRILKGERTVHATWGDVDVLDVIPGEITMGEGAIYIPKRIN
ncbi:hypothetical protein PCG10_005372 [Penicillium crustosum]|uniref:Glycosyltransferase family 25 protein n=1 Tax=Penicillium crustosum TaxID=36656 RepID=A0A9P5GJW3_PENCR|nr:hypothetical protein PCG10_005372 [Penicillium crustosum]